MAVSKNHDIFAWCAGPNLYVNIGPGVLPRLSKAVLMAYSGKPMYISAWTLWLKGFCKMYFNFFFWKIKKIPVVILETLVEIGSKNVEDIHNQFSVKLLLYQLWNFVDLAARRRTPEFYVALGDYEALCLHMGTWFYILNWRYSTIFWPI